MNQKKHLEEIDILYSIGIFLVILGHSHPSDWSLFYGSLYEKLIVFIYIFHMPLFFFIAGYLFEYSDSLERLGWLQWTRNKAGRLLVPYFFWSTVGFIPKCILAYHFGTQVPYNSLISTLIIPRSGVWGHFWFLPTLFVLYCLIVLFTVLFRKKTGPTFNWLVLVLAVFIFFLPIKTDYLCLSDLHTAFLYFAAGMVRCEINKTRPKKKTRHESIAESLILTGLITLVWYMLGQSPIRNLILSFLLILLCSDIAAILPHTKAIQWISKNCLPFFLFSWFFQYTVMVLCQRNRLTWQMTSISMFIAGTVFPALLIFTYRKKILGRSKTLDLLVGIR